MADYSQGKARQVTAPTGGVVKGQAGRINGWNGIFATDADQDKLVAFNVETNGMYYIVVPVAVAVAVGDPIYITAGGVLTATSAGNTLWGKTDEARDGNGVAGVRILNVI